MSLLLNTAAALFALTAAALMLVALAAWGRSRNGRMGLLALGFAAFTAAGATTAWWLFNGDDVESALAMQTALSGMGLFFVYTAAVRK